MKKNNNQIDIRDKAFIGSLISGVASIGSSIIGGISKRKQQKREMEFQEKQQARGDMFGQSNMMTQNMNNQGFVDEYNDRLSYQQGGREKVKNLATENIRYRGPMKEPGPMTENQRILADQAHREYLATRKQREDVKESYRRSTGYEMNSNQGGRNSTDNRFLDPLNNYDYRVDGKRVNKIVYNKGLPELNKKYETGGRVQNNIGYPSLGPFMVGRNVSNTTSTSRQNRQQSSSDVNNANRNSGNNVGSTYNMGINTPFMNERTRNNIANQNNSRTNSNRGNTTQSNSNNNSNNNSNRGNSNTNISTPRNNSNSNSRSNNNRSNSNSRPRQQSVAELWKQQTGTDWSEARRLGYSDGTAESNESIRRRLLRGEDLIGEATRQTNARNINNLVDIEQAGPSVRPIRDERPIDSYNPVTVEDIEIDYNNPTDFNTNDRLDLAKFGKRKRKY